MTMGQQLDRVKATRAARADIGEDLVTEVSDVNELKKCSKNQQADLSLNTLDAWEVRYSLRRTREVREALHLWWMAIARTLKPGLSDGEIPVVEKPTYVRLYDIIFRQLAKQQGERHDAEECKECAEEDWAAESKDGVTMGREAVLSCLFEIADLCATARPVIRARSHTQSCQHVRRAHGHLHVHCLLTLPPLLHASV